MRTLRLAESFYALFTCIVIGLLAGCAAPAPNSGTVDDAKFGGDSEPSVKQDETILAHQEAVFAWKLKAAAKEPKKSDLAQDMFIDGKVWLDPNCSKYLSELGQALQRESNNRQQVGLVGGLASTILGLAGTSSGVAGGTGAAFSFAGASMDAHATAYLFSDSTTGITKLVQGAQDAYMNYIKDDLKSYDYQQSITALSKYGLLCSPGEIRRLINESLSAAKVVAQSPDTQAAQTELVTVLAELNQALSMPVTEGGAIALYAWFSQSDARTNIKTGTKLVATAVTNAGGDNQLSTELSPIFLKLGVKGDAFAARWSSSIGSVPGASKVNSPTSNSPVLGMF